ncbi:hypothetical protein EJP82_02050 [Paenibacillus anaericanus]|uniref:Uncharacterized protein n=1 Tax=Paenibacillus anaericanus TaxID=170367 RepID=A0A433YFR9_9BACL|nr:hypothetical protein [Paenibacillus anaericanus]RUT48739.1 hypothetical protein EJP82_02050 [Paenibacillus anaericanus]
MNQVNPPMNQSKMLSDHDIQSIYQWISKMKHLRSSTRKKDKAISTLHLNYQVLGAGNTRVVFDLDNGHVVKVALSKKGLASNLTEYQLYNQCSRKLRKYLCPVIEFGNGWIIMKKMQPIVSLTEDDEKKLSRLRKRFTREGVQPRGLRNKNLAFSTRHNRIIVIDYGNFKYSSS